MATHTARPFGSFPGVELGFYEYIPDVKPERIVISIHGYGQRGNGTTDLGRVLNEALAREIKVGTYSAQLPAIVLSPQYSGTKIMWDVMDRFIKWACDNYQIPRNRVNMTGISGGGICVMEYLYNYKSVNPPGFASSVVVNRALLVSSCYMDVTKVSRFGISTYLWIVHGTLDQQCPFAHPTDLNNGARYFYDAYKALGGKCRNTYFPWLAHTPTVWNTTYAQPEVKEFICKYS